MMCGFHLITGSDDLLTKIVTLKKVTEEERRDKRDEVITAYYRTKNWYLLIAFLPN